MKPPFSRLKKVLVDTSVWIHHERNGDPQLVSLIKQERIVLHWAVYGELSVGSIKNRESYLADLRLFSWCKEQSPDQILRFIESEKLYNKGYSLVDCALLLSAHEDDLLIYSREKRLNSYWSK